MQQRISIYLICWMCCVLPAIAQPLPSSLESSDSSLLKQEKSSGLLKHPPALLNNIDINVLLRSALEIPDNNNPAAIRLNESRFEVMGDVTPDLSFRVRYRLNSLQAPRSLDNSAGSMDIASVNYNFGKKKNWSVNVGKQAAMVGNWEFEYNPTFEYQYSEFVNYQTNIFLMAIKLGYQINTRHTVFVQLHNTYNETFSQLHANAGYSPDGYTASNKPMGVYIGWQGKFFDDKWLTFYSYDISTYASKAYNNSIAIGNKLALKKVKAYLDLTSSYLPVDYPNIASPAINNYEKAQNPDAVSVFAADINYKSAVLRVDYEFVSQWFLTAKGIYETASKRNDDIIGSNFRKHTGILAGLEYQPVAGQDMKLFGYYYYNRISYKGVVSTANERQTLNLFSIGVLYFVKAL